MQKAVGLWIDHRKAVMVEVTDRGHTTTVIVSMVEKQRGRFDGVRSLEPFESGQVQPDDRQERRFRDHLAIYYDHVIATIGDAETVLIFGPGEAKIELAARLENVPGHTRAVELETRDKMTDRQVAARVWKRFSPLRQPAHN